MKDRRGLYLVVGVVAISFIALVVPAPPIVASDPAAATPQTQAAEKVIPLQGVFRGLSGCELVGSFPPLGRREQTIQIQVNPGGGGDNPTYKVNTYPPCASIHKRGPLTFKVFVSGDVSDWDPNNTFDLNFGVPEGSKPKLKGPFTPERGKKRGQYMDQRNSRTIPPNSMDVGIPVGWIGSYSIDLYDSSPAKKWLGGVDPGVMVVDNP